MKRGLVLGIVIAVVLVLIILLAIFYILINNNNPEEDNFNVTSDCSNLSYYESANCYAKIAFENDNASKCGDISLVASREGIVSYCYKDFAIMKKDAKYCSFGGGSPEMITACANQIASLTNDLSSCENSGSEMFNPNLGRDTCYTNMAISSKNRSICDLLTEVYRTKDCYAKVAMAIGKNDSDCQWALVSKGLCYAVINNNVSYCDENGRQINGCYYDYATVKNDPSACNKMQDQTQREYCLKQFQ